jgi:hypothetical protein
MRNLIVMLVFILSVSAVSAREVAGIELPEQVTLETMEAPLLLNGAGIRKKFFFSIYLASLYLPSRTSEVGAIIGIDQASRVQMDMLYSEVAREKLVAAWNDGFEANHSPEELAPLKERVERFNSMFETLVAGDQVMIDYLPGTGTGVTINGTLRGVIPGHDFNQALLKIWLGESPVSKSLKKDLLGQ